MLITKEKFASIQDHSIVESYATWEDTVRFAQETLDYGFGCCYVIPVYVKALREKFGDKLVIGTPVGFPAGTGTTASRIFEGIDALDNGANCLDTVIEVGLLRSGKIEECRADLKACVKAWKEHSPKCIVKVIIECCYLNLEQKKQAVDIVLSSGADVIKTNTGTGSAGCRMGDVKLIKSIVGDRILVKAASEMKDINQALAAIANGADQIGENQAVQFMKDFDDYIGIWG